MEELRKHCLPRQLRVTAVGAAVFVEHGVEEVPEGNARGDGGGPEDG